MKYIVTENIQSPNKVMKGIEVFDFFFVISYMGICFALSSAVHSLLQPLFIVFSIVVAIFLTSKSIFNKKRRNFESVLILLKKDKDVYRPLYEEKEIDR